MIALAKGLKPKTGPILLANGIATLTVPDTFGYLDPAQAHAVLEKLWGNPPGGDSLGMLIPAGFDPLSDESWAVTIRYEDEGYVKDDDAGKINYGDLLKQMQEGAKEANEERVKQGYSPMTLIGWATPPRYDSAAKKFYWAKELQVGQAKDHTLNYNLRILGRRGYLVLNAISGMSQLKTVENATPQILSMVEFNAGHRYADYTPGTDKVAAYGLAGLVAGGIATKLGLFKGIWIFLLGAKKLLVALVVGTVAAAGKLFNKFLGVRERKDVAGEPPPPANPAA